MIADNIYQLIRGDWDNFLNNDVEVVPGYTFNQMDTIKRCHLYYNSKFENGGTYSGEPKLFFNINKFRCDVATRFLNFDTKDIRLWENNSESELKTFLLEKELQLWMKRNKVGKLLNEIAEEAPIYGSVVIRKNKKGAVLVDLRRFALDPTVETVGKSRFLSVKHYLTESEVREKAKTGGWDAKAVEDMLKTKGTLEGKPSYESDKGYNQITTQPTYEVTEYWGDVAERLLGGKGEDLVRAFFIVGNLDVSTKNDKGELTGGEAGLTLFKSRWTKEYPFKDFHYSKTRGRWLGRGVIEDLFEAQERTNEMTNQKRVSMKISAQHTFQTSGNTGIQNIVQDLVNGDVIQNGGNLITPIATEERNLAAFTTETQEYDKLADRLSFAFDSVRGESMPSSTPATNAMLQNQGASSVFAFKRENLGLTLQAFFNDFVLPQLMSDLTPEHVLRFTGSLEDISKLDRAISESMTREEVLKRLLSGRPVTDEDQKQIKANIESQLKKRGAKRFIEVSKGFYGDADFEFDFMVTNEQEDVAVAAQNLMGIITALSKNPEMLKNPMIKVLFNQYAQKIGVSPARLELAEQEESEQQAQGQEGQMPSQPDMASMMQAMAGAGAGAGQPQPNMMTA
ncbi:MAG: hypothetical protein WC551_02695 [Patescibacteria group bacterium]